MQEDFPEGSVTADSRAKPANREKWNKTINALFGAEDPG